RFSRDWSSDVCSSDLGLEPVNRMAYYGILGPKGLPKDVVDKINAGVKKAVEDPAVRQRIEDTGSLIVANTPAEFAAQIKAEYARSEERRVGNECRSRR